MTVAGSCFCKKIKIQAEVTNNMIVHCYRNDCHAFSGAPYRAVVLLKRTSSEQQPTRLSRLRSLIHTD